MNRRGKILAFSTVAVGLVVLVVVGIISNGWILEQWYLQRLGSDDVTARKAAVEYLGRNGSVKALVPLLEMTTFPGEPDNAVRGSAAYWAGKIAPKKSATPYLITLLGQNRVPDFRRLAAWALGEIRAGSKEVVSALIIATKDTSQPVRKAAAEALGKIGPSAVEAVPPLEMALEDESEPVRQAAAEALKRIQGTQDEPQK